MFGSSLLILMHGLKNEEGLLTQILTEPIFLIPVTGLETGGKIDTLHIG